MLNNLEATTLNDLYIATIQRQVHAEIAKSSSSIKEALETIERLDTEAIARAVTMDDELWDLIVSKIRKELKNGYEKRKNRPS